ncbi:hypothetical protein F5146DRAFT_1206939 [Armillaria mellea]|nr:hypothetical protein F5146DRAFT_1206939 [Armillaria mellea]
MFLVDHSNATAELRRRDNYSQSWRCGNRSSRWRLKLLISAVAFRNLVNESRDDSALNIYGAIQERSCEGISSSLFGAVSKNATLFPVIVKSIRQQLLTVPIPTTPVDPLLQAWEDAGITTIRTCFVCLKNAISHLESEDECSITLVSRSLWPEVCRCVTTFLDIHVVNVPSSSLPLLYRVEAWFAMVDAILTLLLDLSRTTQW